MLSKLWNDLFRPIGRPLPIVGIEGHLARIFFAIMVCLMMPEKFVFGSQDRPTGLAHYFDLTWLSEPSAMPTVRIVVGVLCLLYAANLILPVVLPVLTLLHVIVFTFNNSQGYTHHGNQIISLILVAQTLVTLTMAVYRKATGRPLCSGPGVNRDSCFIYFSQVVVAGVYMTSVVSKFDESGGQWVQKLPNISVQLIKTHRQEFYSNPAKSSVARDAEVPMSQYMLENPTKTRFVLTAGMIVEGIAGLCLLNRGWGLVFGLLLIMFHTVVAHMFHLYFDLNKWASLIYLINIPFWIMYLLGVPIAPKPRPATVPEDSAPR